MRSVIIGDSPLLNALRKRITAHPYDVPAGNRAQDQATFLANHPVPDGQQGVVFAAAAANWLPVANAGWKVLWCDATIQPPYGSTPVLEGRSTWTVADLVYEYWNERVVDRRLVDDVLHNRRTDVGTMLSVTSNTGGVGKTTSSRRIAERAADMGVHTLLVDGNMLQSSQRSFFDPMMSMDVSTIASWRPGLPPTAAATHGRTLGVKYDVVFAPPAGSAVSWDMYRRYLRQARRRWQFVVLDLDRINADDFNDKDSMAGSLLMPSIIAGDPCLVIVRAGRQTQADAANLLGAMREQQLPVELIGIKDTVPIGLQDSYRKLDYEGYGMFLGTEYMSVEAAQKLSEGASNWADPYADNARERVLEWVLPEAGFDPSRFESAATGKSKGHGKWFSRS